MGTFASMGTHGLEILNNLPGTAIEQTHYTQGGKPGAFTQDFGGMGKLWDPLGFVDKMSEETRKKKRLAELNNGRLAMIGIASFAATNFIPGSVPALPSPF